MWIFSVLPDWIIHLIFAAGVIGTIAGFVLGFIPFIKQYKLPIQIISVIVLAFGLYLEGGLADYKEWELRVRELEAKLAEAETRSAKVNTVVVERVVTKTQVVRERGQNIIRYVDREIVKNNEVIKFVENCPLPREIVEVHNAAAMMNEAAEGGKK